MIRWSVDPTGFPVVEIAPLGKKMQALPVTKVQFERFIADPNRYDDAWYAGVLALNPRVTFRRLGPEPYERLFLTGIQLETVRQFAAWLGEGWRVPSAPEWSAAYTWLSAQGAVERPGCWNDLSQTAKTIWEGLYRAIRPGQLAQQTLMKAGVLEWVIEPGPLFSQSGGMGAPRDIFWRILRQPCDEPIHPGNHPTALKPFGFRLMRGIE